MHGDLEQLPDGRWRLRFTRTLPHPPDKVWRAVTEPEHLAHWFPTTIEGERSSGAPLRFSFPRAQAEPFTGEMLAYDEGSAMELSWGDDIVRLELREAPTGTELTLLDTLEERGKAARDGPDGTPAWMRWPLIYSVVKTPARRWLPGPRSIDSTSSGSAPRPPRSVRRRDSKGQMAERTGVLRRSPADAISHVGYVRRGNHLGRFHV